MAVMNMGGWIQNIAHSVIQQAMALPVFLAIPVGVINMVAMASFAYIVALQVPVLPALLVIQMGVTKNNKLCINGGRETAITPN